MQEDIAKWPTMPLPLDTSQLPQNHIIATETAYTLGMHAFRILVDYRS